MVDFDDASQSVVGAARRLGIIERTDLIALHIFDAPATGMMKRAMQPPEAIDHYVGSEERRVRTEFDAFLCKAGLARSQQLLRPNEGSAAGIILSCADEQGINLIVVGTNQRKGLAGFLLGSVAQKVLLDAKQDVLVVPATNDAEEPTPQ